MKRLLVASTNPGKLRELHALLQGASVELVTPSLIGLHLEVREDGSTYAENAAKKALAFARASGLLTLADDSGLEVEVLEGAPGLHSARYAPQPNATDADRRAYLLQQLQGHPRPWSAQFRCVVALALPDGEVHFAEGICHGEIIPEERGEHGFGYDPIFLLPQYGRTMAELSMEEKNRISHRARAVRAALPLLLDLIARL
jgi:XTP/dITP diphosphohydrolase